MAKKVQDPSLGMTQNENPEKVFDAKEMLQKNADAGTKIKYNDRMAIEILVDTKFYKKGQIVNPHKVKGQALVDQKIGKKYIAQEED